MLQPRNNWSVVEGQLVMRDATSWGLEKWDALEGLAASWHEMQHQNPGLLSSSVPMIDVL